MSEVRGGSPISEAYSDGLDSLSMRDKALLKRSVSKHHNNNLKAGYVPVHEQYLSKTGLRGRKTFAFWTLVGLLFILAVGNLVLTVTILGVLRLGLRMQSMELISEESTIKFFGDTNLDHVYKADGRIEGFQDVPLKIESEDGAIYFNLESRDARPITKLSLERNQTAFLGFDNFEIRNQFNNVIFSTATPHFHNLHNAHCLRTKKVTTNRIVGPKDEKLLINYTTINLKGAEGTRMESREIVWSAGGDIYLKSINGSLVLSGKEGTYVDITAIPIAQTDERNYMGSHYKVCVCMPHGKLFRIPIAKGNVSAYCNHVKVSEQNNLCM